MNLSAHTPRVGFVGRDRTAHSTVLDCRGSPRGILLLAYFALTTAEPTTEVRYLVYPFVWINAGLWAVRRVTPTPGTRTHRAVGIVIAIAYLFVVLYIPGRSGSGPQVHQPIFV